MTLVCFDASMDFHSSLFTFSLSLEKIQRTFELRVTDELLYTLAGKTKLENVSPCRFGVFCPSVKSSFLPCARQGGAAVLCVVRL